VQRSPSFDCAWPILRCLFLRRWSGRYVYSGKSLKKKKRREERVGDTKGEKVKWAHAVQQAMGMPHEKCPSFRFNRPGPSPGFWSPPQVSIITNKRPLARGTVNRIKNKINNRHILFKAHPFSSRPWCKGGCTGGLRARALAAEDSPVHKYSSALPSQT